MNKKTEEYKRDVLSIDDSANSDEMLKPNSQSRWRKAISSAFLLIYSYGVVITFGYMLFNYPELQCWGSFFYLSIFWLMVQTAVIAFLYLYSNIPAFARWSISLLIMISNIWFILFLFSLKPCAV